jgi:hypothetical protein
MAQELASLADVFDFGSGLGVDVAEDEGLDPRGQGLVESL